MPAPPPVFLLSHALDDAGSCGASARLRLFHSIAQFPARQKAVEFPGSVRMAFDGDARGRVPEVNAVVGFIYFLAASPASADKAFLQILFTDAQGLHPFPESCQFFRPDHSRRIAGC